MKRKKQFSTRNELGISQQDLAMYLKVSRSLVELEEKGERNLPTLSMVKYSQLSRAMDLVQPSSKLTDYNNKKRMELAPKLQLRSRYCQAKANVLKTKLADMQELCRLASNAILTINNLRENIIPAETHIKHTKHETDWLRGQENLAFIKLDKYGIKAQSKLMLQIKLLEFEAVAILGYLPDEQ
jgi:transcriptional regulator with XRE-family HTH domain